MISSSAWIYEEKDIPKRSPAEESGFAWIECLVVAAVLAVLAAVLVPVIGNMRESARRAACAENLREQKRGHRS